MERSEFMKAYAEEILDWVVKIGWDEFNAIDKQRQFRSKVERYKGLKAKNRR